MQKRKKTFRTTNKSVPKKRQIASRRTRKANGNLLNVFVPLLLIVCILSCLGALAFIGYRTAISSEFFEVKKIEINGTSRTSKDEIESIVRKETEKVGVWNADLKSIKEQIENMGFVKSAVVSRVLPDGIRINVLEREPKAVVRLEGGDFWVDEEGVILASVTKNEKRPPFVLRGWDMGKTEKARRDNQQKVKIYLKMLEEWQQFGLAETVKEVNLSNPDEAKAIVEDSGKPVQIALGKENYAKRLQKGIEAIAGKGNNFEAVNLVGQNLILVPRQNN